MQQGTCDAVIHLGLHRIAYYEALVIVNDSKGNIETQWLLKTDKKLDDNS